MKILALDQASRISGYSIFDSVTGKLITYGKITCTDQEINQRLMKIRQLVENLIDEYQIDQLVVEDIQLQEYNGRVQLENVVTYKVLAEVLGVVTELAAERQLPCEIVFSNTWKSACQIGGRTRPEQKRNAQNHIAEKYQLKVSQDEADAICIGEYYISKKACAW